ncbi:hypothetical protein QZH41_003824 [Actinostola sp. cb2023]|nr:hypothetical protein QZH41_003824 [Actinostola sp. cb2023]
MSILIIEAIRSGSVVEVLHLLKKPGQYVNVPVGKRGRSPLHIAIQENKKRIAEALVSQMMADLDVTDNDEYTPLMIAIDDDNSDLVRWLIDKGAETKGKYPDGKTYEESSKNDEILGLLRAAKYRVASNASHMRTDTLMSMRRVSSLADCLGALLVGEDHVEFTYDNTTVQIPCDQCTNGGGWLVIGTRSNTPSYFQRTLDQYNEGFWENNEKFWLGSNIIASMIEQSSQLLIEMQDSLGTLMHVSCVVFKLEGTKMTTSVHMDECSGNGGDVSLVSLDDIKNLFVNSSLNKVEMKIRPVDGKSNQSLPQYPTSLPSHPTSPPSHPTSPPSHPVTQSPSHPVTQSPYQSTQSLSILPVHPVTQYPTSPPSHSVTQSPYESTQSPSHPTSPPSHSVSYQSTQSLSTLQVHPVTQSPSHPTSPPSHPVTLPVHPVTQYPTSPPSHSVPYKSTQSLSTLPVHSVTQYPTIPPSHSVPYKSTQSLSTLPVHPVHPVTLPVHPVTQYPTSPPSHPVPYHSTQSLSTLPVHPVTQYPTSPPSHPTCPPSHSVPYQSTQYPTSPPSHPVTLPVHPVTQYPTCPPSHSVPYQSTQSLSTLPVHPVTQLKRRALCN